MILKIRPSTHPALRNENTKVVNFDRDLTKLAKKMLFIMNKEKGVGLAACQVGVNIRFAIASNGGTPYFLCNPEILDLEDPIKSTEGCLSVKGTIKVVPRFNKAVIKYQDLSGAEKILAAEGLLAICIQHEIDHINQKMIIDYE